MKTLRCFPPMVSSCCPLYSSPRTTLFFKMWFSRMILSNLWSMDITSAADKTTLRVYTLCVTKQRPSDSTTLCIMPTPSDLGLLLHLKFSTLQGNHTWDDHCYQLKREKESKCAQMVGDLLVNALLTGASKVYSAFGLIAAERPNSDTMSPKVDWEVPNSSITCLA